MISLLAAVSLSLAQDLSETALLQPGKIAEPCMVMEEGQRLEFEFLASGDLDFNLHYHEDSAVHFPVNLRNTRGESGVFIAPTRRTYCLMWTNRGESNVQLEYNYQLFDVEILP